jgi:hypothetical protein
MGRARSRPTSWITVRELAAALDLSISGTHKLIARVPGRFVRKQRQGFRVFGPAAAMIALGPKCRRALEREQIAAARAAQQRANDESDVLLEFQLAWVAKGI